MFSKLHERLGTAGLAVAIVALVAALAGTAVAASGGLSGKQKKEVEKIAKKYAGKNGAAGPAGPAGSAGAAGAAGKDGKNGTNGTNGQSVTVNSYTGPECAESPGEEGAEFTNGSGTGFACNGKEGSPWTAGGTLPSNKTETGSWSTLGVLVGGPAATSVPISFNIPLAQELETSKVHFVFGEVESAEGTGNTTNNSKNVTGVVLTLNEFKHEMELVGTGIPAEALILNVEAEAEEGKFKLLLNKKATATGTGVTLKGQRPTTPAACTGTVSEPKAAQGHLCVYAGGILGGGTGTLHTIAKNDGTGTGASKSGAALILESLSETVSAVGSWAVTAP